MLSIKTLTDEMIMQGKILASRYQIIHYIGKGGFGKTYLAEDIDLPTHNRCVVKQLYPQINHEPNFLNIARRLFEKEGETLNKLHHPQIPRLVAYFEEEQQFYLVQEYIEGHTLSQEIKPGLIWSENAVIELLRDCLNILDFIHHNGVIHRDVKPDNLIRRHSDRKLVLVDFGTVKEFVLTQSQLIPSTVAVGTRGYMPTEQAIGKPRPSSDLYALGMMGIQALTGIHPLELPDDEYGELLWQPKTQVSPQLAEILTKMVRYHFGDRFHSAREALKAINANITTAIPASSARYTATGMVNHFQLNQSSATSDSPTTLISSPQTQANSNNYNSGITKTDLSSQALTSQFPASEPDLTQISAPVSKIDRYPVVSDPYKPIPVENPGRNQTNFNHSKQKKLIVWLSAIAVGTVAVAGVYLFNQNNTEIASNNTNEQVEQLKGLIAQNNYQECYDKVTQIDSGLSATEKSQFQAQCGIGMAKEQAQSLKYGEALALIAKLPQNTSYASQIEQLTTQWSQELFNQAQTIYSNEGKLSEALELIEQIPASRAIASQAQIESDRWKSEYGTNKNIIANAQEALNNRNWQTAKQEAIKIQDSTSSYWREQARTIITQAEAEIAALSSPLTPTPPTTQTNSQPVEKPITTETQPTENPQPVEKPITTETQPTENSQPVEKPITTETQPTENSQPVEEKSTYKATENQPVDRHYGNMPVDDLGSSQPQPQPKPNSEDNSDWAL